MMSSAEVLLMFWLISTIEADDASTYTDNKRFTIIVTVAIYSPSFYCRISEEHNVTALAKLVTPNSCG